jgi:hypothetical protein
MKKKVRICKAQMDSESGPVECARKSGHTPPHRTSLLTWHCEESGEMIGKRVAEWRKPRGLDAELRRS